MKFAHPSRWGACCAALFLLLPVGPLAMAQSEANPAAAESASQPLAEQARVLLADGKAIQALAVARRAAQEAPDDYKAAYYVAYALMELGEGAEAQRHAERSLQLAPSTKAKAAVQDLLATLQAVSTLKEADSAAAEGLHAKAGRLYLQVWERGVLPAQKTIVAADLFQNRLQDTRTAARLLRDLPTRYAGTPEADEAAKRLVGLRSALKAVAEDALAHARKREPGNAERTRWLQAALEADPDMQDAHLALANDAAESGDWAALEPRLKTLQRKGWLQGQLESRGLVLGQWQQDARLRGLLADIWGDKRGGELLAMNTATAQTLSPEAAQERVRRQQAETMAAFEAAGLKAGTGAAFRDCGNCPEMVWIPPGAMPQRPEGSGTLVPWTNRMRINYPLAVGKYELTYDEWDACTAAGACRAIDEGRTDGILFDTKWGRGRQPVVWVSWDDARAYTAWLSKKTGQNYRLLSLAEHSYAARAGRASGALADGGANCPGCSPKATDRTLAVGGFAPNGWGLHDMIGNVAEMVADCHMATSRLSEAVADGSPNTVCAPERNAAGNMMIVTGGSFVAGQLDGLRLEADRESNPFTLTRGFRVARTYQP